MQSEYLHLLLVPALTHALPLATLGLLLALVFRSAPAARLALALILISGALVWPAVHSGEGGYDQVKSMVYASGVDWLNVHRWRAAHWAWVFYAAAGCALLALLLPLPWPRVRQPLALLTLVAALGATAAGCYIAYPGGRVRHKELRHGQPDAAQLHAAQKAYDTPADASP
jgi:hypothetical protein